MIFTFLIITLIIQMAFFAYAAWKKSDIVTDLSYGLTFVVLVWIAIFINFSFSLPLLLLAGAVTFWGGRLAGYLFSRILKMKKDDRFDGIREHFWKFFQFWFFQGISIWVISLPFIVVLSKDIVDFQPIHFVALSISVFGVIFEGIADNQKSKFKSDPKNKGQWLETGLWKYSRHPNYFGEMLMWWGIFLFGVLTYSNLEWLVLISPLYIMVLLLFITGVPTLEKRYDERFKDNDAYWEYKNSTSMIVPWFRK